jgi:hypothetical protein
LLRVGQIYRAEVRNSYTIGRIFLLSGSNICGASDVGKKKLALRENHLLHLKNLCQYCFEQFTTLPVGQLLKARWEESGRS